jgi:hypothetical protein
MAQIRLKTNECARGYLPLVCVRCGQLADDSKPFKFSRIPIWMYVLFFLCGIPCVITAIAVHPAVLASSLLWLAGVILLRRAVTVDLPVCPRHRRGVGLRAFGLFILIPLIVVLIVAVVGVPIIMSRQRVALDGFGFCLLPVILVILIGLVALVNRGGIRVTSITDSGVTLKGVHSHFADVVRELRDARYDDRGAVS